MIGEVSCSLNLISIEGMEVYNETIRNDEDGRALGRGGAQAAFLFHLQLHTPA
jgi:hypothetical protein